uniref:Reverse transcriptase zinc-binding domain-containing protein n=1 Tax=Setaria viridis TaxID=4556 RepID=A0A4U6VEB2_SETVI|nr:hypothetical protein SEVIR_3G231800v2 [Setaria viridis]
MALPSNDCVHCMIDTKETLQLLFLECEFAQDCWALIHLVVPYQILTSFKQQLAVPFYMKVIILMCWTIWLSRNDFIFKSIAPNLERSRVILRKLFDLMLHRAKRVYFPLIQ